MGRRGLKGQNKLIGCVKNHQVSTQCSNCRSKNTVPKASKTAFRGGLYCILLDIVSTGGKNATGGGFRPNRTPRFLEIKDHLFPPAFRLPISSEQVAQHMRCKTTRNQFVSSTGHFAVDRWYLISWL